MIRKEFAFTVLAVLLMGMLFSFNASGMDVVNNSVGQDTICGPGAFHAKGIGMGTVCGKGVVVLKGDGVELIHIRHVSKTQVKIVGKGTIVPVPNEDSIVVVGLKGRVQLKGKHISVSFSGGPLIVNGSGHGKIWLRGHGQLKIKGKPMKDWPLKIHEFKY